MLILFVLALLLNVSNVSAANVTADQVANASGTVKSYVETNHTLPSTVNVSGNVMNMSNYLGVSTSAILNINSNLNATITIKSFGGAPSPSENVTSRNISKAEYLDIANRVRTYMDANGRAPNYATQTSTGSTIRYESLVYMYSKILNFYNVNKVLPNYVTVNPWTIVSNPNVIGSTSYGYVEKKFYGNQSSNKTIVLIIGMHPQENGIHTAIYNALVSKSASLTKRYVLYYIHVTQNADDYNQGRMNGQLLGQQFIVPNVSGENPMLVMDNHENHGASSGYDYWRFLYPISNTTITTTYANQIISQMPFLVIYPNPPNPTSPQYVTIPIANQGIPTIIYETIFNDTTAQKASYANDLINALNNLNNGTVHSTNLTAAANPIGGSFNASQTVTLTTDPNSTATIYYTTDRSDPTTNSTKYTSPIIIDTTTTLNFAAFDTAGNQSPVYTETYIIDAIPPTAYANPSGGRFSAPQYVVLRANDDQDANPIIYYTTDGSNPKTSNTRTRYNSQIYISSTTTLKFYAVDGVGNASPTIYTEKYTIDKSAPIVWASLASGYYNTNKLVTLKMNEPGAIYYTRNGITPTIANINKYMGPISVTFPTLLKFFAVDDAGNKSPVYIKGYVIDKTPPKVIATYPKNYARGISRTSTIAIKFSENIKASVNWSKIYVKNLSTGRMIQINKWIRGNMLYIKTTLNRRAYNWYRVYIPYFVVKDYAGNKLARSYSFIFKTGRY